MDDTANEPVSGSMVKDETAEVSAMAHGGAAQLVPSGDHGTVPGAVSTEALDDTKKVVEAPLVEPEDLRISLDDFCRLVSKKDRRVEHIAAFHYMEECGGEEHGGKPHDTQENYRKRYEEFGSRTVV